MKRFFVLLMVLLSVQFSFAQTGKPIRISGTKYGMVPPAGFVVATAFSGFQHSGTGASIMINELPAPYQQMVDGFTADALKSRGMTLVSKEVIEFYNAKATLFNVTQPANGITYSKQIFVFGDAGKTVMVNGIYPETARDMAPKIKAALLSTVYDAAQNDDPLEAVAFTVDVRETDFKLVKYIAGSLLYSADGKIPTDKPTLIVGNSLATVTAPDKKKFAEQRLADLPHGDQSIIKETNPITINGLAGYETVADGKTKDGKPSLVYQAMLFTGEGNYYLLVGQADEDFPKNLAAFRKVAASFKRK